MRGLRRSLLREPAADEPEHDRYFGLGAREARRLGHPYIGSEHVLLALASVPEGAAARALDRLGLTPNVIDEQIRRRPGSPPPTGIDPQALATLGIDLDTVRDRVEQTFGEGALEDTRTGCMRVEPCLKQVLQRALTEAGDQPLGDQHVLLGLVAVEDSFAARLLSHLGIAEKDVRAALAS